MSDPLRTQIRTGLEHALLSLKTSANVYHKSFGLSRYWLNHDEPAQYPTYCVIVTDEDIKNQSHEWRECTITGVIVAYVKDDQDARAVLDQAIEDVWKALVESNNLGGAVRELGIDGIECDDGTKIAKPYAQAILRWNCIATRPRKPA